MLSMHKGLSLYACSSKKKIPVDFDTIGVPYVMVKGHFGGGEFKVRGEAEHINPSPKLTFN
jgi:hypothetical protein